MIQLVNKWLTSENREVNSASKLRRLTYRKCCGKMPTELALGTSQVNCEVNFKLCVEKLTLFTCSHGLCSSLNVTGEGKRDFLEGIVSFGELYTSE